MMWLSTNQPPRSSWRFHTQGPGNVGGARKFSDTERTKVADEDPAESQAQAARDTDGWTSSRHEYL